MGGYLWDKGTHMVEGISGSLYDTGAVSQCVLMLCGGMCFPGWQVCAGACTVHIPPGLSCPPRLPAHGSAAVAGTGEGISAVFNGCWVLWLVLRGGWYTTNTTIVCSWLSL